ncbi:MAG: hypothetical protein CVV27_12035 [Candidatus Melainabacteria bacterium HGW-Melainabacteria-1]|nr:MAG: hypothetical protein CVV27_12035 [Candidatus Melainabacteria bacterium HGW-Melainabacteria-1]
MQAKLTLSLDPEVIAQAKLVARSSQTSLSSLVESYLRQLIAQSETNPAQGPVLRQLSGILKDASVTDYVHHLENKYL